MSALQVLNASTKGQFLYSAPHFQENASLLSTNPFRRSGFSFTEKPTLENFVKRFSAVSEPVNIL